MQASKQNASSLETFADYAEAAGLPVCAPWFRSLTLREQPFRHQVGDLTHLAAETRAGLYNEPGVGKTLPMQGYGLWLVAQGNKVIYLMPPGLVDQFCGSFRAMYQGVDRHAWIHPFRAGPDVRQRWLADWRQSGWPDVLVMGYKMFVAHWQDFKDAGYTCVVVDEATAVKNPSSQIHASVKCFAGKPGPASNGVVLATGSPVDTNVVDAYGLIAILDPYRYGSKRAFDRRHVIYASSINGGNNFTRDAIVGYKDYAYLRESLFKQGRRVKKADVLDLPPRLVTEHHLTLHPKHKALYDRLVDERLLSVGDEVIDATTQSALYQAMQRILLSPEQFCDAAPPNHVLEQLDTLLDTLDGHKVLVYAWFQDSIKKLLARYAGRNPAALYGQVSGSRRDEGKHRFINDPACTLLVANPKSGGVGVDGLQHVCSYVIYAEICPFPGVFQQSVDRLHRSGQRAGSVNVHLLVPAGTIAVKLRNDLVRKDLQQEQVIVDKRKLLHDLMGGTGIKGSLDLNTLPERKEYG